MEEVLGGAAEDDAGALVVQEGGGGAFEDADVVAEAFEDDGAEEAAEGAADLWRWLLDGIG